MIFHENRLLADDSHELSFLISFEHWERCRKICLIGDLRVYIKFGSYLPSNTIFATAVLVNSMSQVLEYSL